MTSDPIRRIATHFPNIPLRTQDGRRVRFYDDLVRGKVVTINFMFTSCTEQCPLTTANLRRLQQALGAHAGRDVFQVSVSIDPAHDDPPALREYASRFGAGPGWTFATGSAADVIDLQARLGMPRRDGELHTGMLVYGNEPKGRWAATPIMQPAQSLARIILRVVEPIGT
jgi:protein SCO1/2